MNTPPLPQAAPVTLFTDITRYERLRVAHELAVRQSELSAAIAIVERAGCSVELTEAVCRLGARQDDLRAQLQRACAEAIWEAGWPRTAPGAATFAPTATNNASE